MIITKHCRRIRHTGVEPFPIKIVSQIIMRSNIPPATPARIATAPVIEVIEQVIDITGFRHAVQGRFILNRPADQGG